MTEIPKNVVKLDGKTILVTGAAGFIGAALSRRLLNDCCGGKIIGLDSLNDYYDVTLKEKRLSDLDRVAVDSANGNEWCFVKGSIADKEMVERLFAEYEPSVVVNLAAQAGVRYSIENPRAYMEANVIGFFNVLEACRHSYDIGKGVEHLVYASSSSVYGDNAKIPYSVGDKTDSPVSLYAATKKSNELMAHTYSKLYNIPATGLRFFTVYGPAGRPDMAYFKFAERMRTGQDIEIYNYGHCERDFTYIDDIVEGIVRVMGKAPDKCQGENGLPIPPCSVYNIGRGKPVNLLDFVTILQEELKKAKVLPADYDFESHRKLLPMQPGDVAVTYADTKAMEQVFGYRPLTDLRMGLRKFAEWYKNEVAGGDICGKK